MNKTLKAFLHRGLLFAGFGPVVLGIVYAILENTLEDFRLAAFRFLLQLYRFICSLFCRQGLLYLTR